jgi:parvulin-like peptidyl-prolyl isomerase
LEQKPAVQMQLKLQTDNALASALFTEISNDAAISPEAARKYYDDHLADYEQARARHILVRMKGSQVPLAAGKKELSEEEALAKAKELREKISAGADFATVAKAESDDAGSAVNGGDLGSFTRGKMVAQFEQVAFTLPVGQISEPVKTQFGYHIIKVDQREAKTFDELKPDIEKRMRADMARQTMDDLRKKSAVVIDESYFAVAPPAAGTPAPAVK